MQTRRYVRIGKLNKVYTILIHWGKVRCFFWSLLLQQKKKLCVPERCCFLIKQWFYWVKVSRCSLIVVIIGKLQQHCKSASDWHLVDAKLSISVFLSEHANRQAISCLLSMKTVGCHEDDSCPCSPVFFATRCACVICFMCLYVSAYLPDLQSGTEVSEVRPCLTSHAMRIWCRTSHAYMCLQCVANTLTADCLFGGDICDNASVIIVQFKLNDRPSRLTKKKQLES